MKQRYEVTGYTKTGMYSTVIEATGPVGALVVGKREVRLMAPAKVRRWSVRLA